MIDSDFTPVTESQLTTLVKCAEFDVERVGAPGCHAREKARWILNVIAELRAHRENALMGGM